MGWRNDDEGFYIGWTGLERQRGDGDSSGDKRSRIWPNRSASFCSASDYGSDYNIDDRIYFAQAHWDKTYQPEGMGAIAPP